MKRSSSWKILPVDKFNRAPMIDGNITPHFQHRLKNFLFKYEPPCIPPCTYIFVFFSWFSWWWSWWWSLLLWAYGGNFSLFPYAPLILSTDNSSKDERKVMQRQEWDSIEEIFSTLACLTSAYPYCGLQVYEHFEQGLLKIIVVEVMIGDEGFTQRSEAAQSKALSFYLAEIKTMINRIECREMKVFRKAVNRKE